MKGAITKEGLVKFLRMLFWRPIRAITVTLWGGGECYRYTLIDAITMKPCGHYYEIVYKDGSVSWEVKLDHQKDYQQTTTGGFAAKERALNRKLRDISVSLFGY